MIVRLPEAVADARRRVVPHAAPARRMIEIAAGAGRENLAVVRLRQLLENAQQAPARGLLPRQCCGVEAMLDLRQRVAPAVSRLVIERQGAVPVRMHVVVSAHASCPAPRTLAP